MLKHMCDARARAIDCFCIVGIWHILLDDVKSAARPTATGRWTADTACESLHSAPSKADAAPGLHPCACTANVAFGRRVAAAFKSPRRTALCISPFSFNIPNNPSIHPAGGDRLRLPRESFPLSCFVSHDSTRSRRRRLNFHSKPEPSRFHQVPPLPLDTRPPPPVISSNWYVNTLVRLPLFYFTPLYAAHGGYLLSFQRRGQGPLGKDRIWCHC